MTNENDSYRSNFLQGFAAAQDQTNQVAIQKGGSATTTLNSHWLHRYCFTCNHTFRVGDEVYISIDGTIEHNDTSLPCAQTGKAIEPKASSEMSAFFTGLEQAWPPSKDVPIVRLEAEHELLAPPFSGFKRHKCLVCSHTLRLSDHVVICPCSPHKPLCKVAVHRDLVHGMYCLEAWNPGANRQTHCPVTSRELNG
jgi:hypothetical protein